MISISQQTKLIGFYGEGYYNYFNFGSNSKCLMLFLALHGVRKGKCWGGWGHMAVSMYHVRSSYKFSVSLVLQLFYYSSTFDRLMEFFTVPTTMLASCGVYCLNVSPGLFSQMHGRSSVVCALFVQLVINQFVRKR